jgi:hypothetical protein
MDRCVSYGAQAQASAELEDGETRLGIGEMMPRNYNWQRGRTARAWKRWSIAAAALLFGTGDAAGQDSHYWATQYGNQSRLLAGAVIGSVADVSAVFYNPGALALIESAELLLSGNVFEYTAVDYRGLVGGEENFDSNGFKSLPSMVAGEIPFNFLGENRLAYSFLIRQDFDFRIRERGVLSGEDLGLPALDLLSGDVRIDQDLTESWGGLTWARTLGPVSVGVTQFIAVRNQRTEFQIAAQGLGVAGETLVSLQNRDFRYQTWRILWKAGVSKIVGRWQLGLTLTTPGVSLGGSGDVGFDSTFVLAGSDRPEVGTGLVTTTQENLPARYKSPLSIGGGGAYTFNRERARVHFAAEWFNAIGEYAVIDSEPFTAPESGDTISFDITQELNSVFNAGVGIENQFSELLGAYAGFRTDFNAGLEEPARGGQFPANVSRWDLYHVSLGSTFTIERSDFTLGTVFSFGHSEPFDPLDFLPGLRPPDQARMAEASLFRITIILGFGLAGL